uniref:P-type ATPase A domain-containing protein n=1 Tax=Acrobeloides nanus TaxID=290746 RepID=A0A914DVB2_9BILA
MGIENDAEANIKPNSNKATIYQPKQQLQTCLVIRDGVPQEINACGLVVGDIIKIQTGKRIPSDARVLQCTQLKLETSSITGEAEPIDYTSDPVPETINIFESKNVAFNGSLCVDGEGIGVVIRTGVETVIGQIATLTTGQPNKKSRLEMQIKMFVKFLIFMALTIGTIVFVIGGFVHKWENVPMLLATSYAVCAVGMVPEVIARRLASKHVYLKRLDIVEALGSANIIATDKTGTLTKNVMTVTDLWYHDEVITNLSLGEKTNVTRSIENYESPLSDLLLAMTICNKAQVINNNEETVISMQTLPKLDSKEHQTITT